MFGTRTRYYGDYADENDPGTIGKGLDYFVSFFTACMCGPIGSIDNRCVLNGETAGQCNCKSGFIGKKCNHSVAY